MRTPLHMTSCRRTARHALLLIAILTASSSSARADFKLIDRVGALFDDVARGFDFLGEKAEDLVGPGLGFGDPDSATVTHSRQFDHKYPVPGASVVSVFNEFGEIRVQTWDNHIVALHAEIVVRADSPELAAELCQDADAAVTLLDNTVVVRTSLPPAPNLGGASITQINYALTIPRDAGLNAENVFGDTIVSGIGGPLAIESRYGAIELDDIRGPVNVHARGEFPLSARNLSQGGAFVLSGSHARFEAIAGSLRVHDFRGSIELRAPAPGSAIELTTESAPITFYVNDLATLDIVATSLFGAIQSDVPLAETVQGSLITARGPNTAATQHVSLSAAFADIHIRREISPDGAPLPSPHAAEPFKQILTHSQPLAETGTVAITNIRGDINITGIDENNVRVTATKLARVKVPGAAAAALQAIDCQFEITEDGLHVHTTELEDMSAIGCTTYRVNIEVQCPRAAILRIDAQQGTTTILDTAGSIKLLQNGGEARVEHAKGELDLTNRNGSIAAANCLGPVRASTSHGSLTMRHIHGKMRLDATQGKTVIETPRAGVYLRASDGDVRLIALEGVNGDYDIEVERGNLGALIPSSADVSLTLTAEHGLVRTTLSEQLTGAIQEGYQRFIATLNEGTFHLDLTAKHGDVVID